MDHDEEPVEMWFKRINPNVTVTSPPSPVFTLFGSQNDNNVESQLCSDLSRMKILNDGIGTSRGPKQQHQQGFMNVNNSGYPSWVRLHNNFVTEPISPPPPRHDQQPTAKRTFPKEQTFGKSQVDSSSRINFGNIGSSYEGSTNSYYLFSPAPAPAPGTPPPLCYREIQFPQRKQIIRRPPPLAFECDNNNSYIILKNETKRSCRSVCGATRRNHFHGESSKNNGIDLKQQQQEGMMMYEFLVRFQGSMLEMAKDQNGCRLLQNSFDGENIHNMEIVFNGIIDNVVPLMMDPFGNYLVQKLLDFCFDYQRLKIVLMLTKKPGHLVTISLNPHGTRVVQKLIKTLKTNMEIQLVRAAIQPGFLQLIKDPNGNHVIQSCLLYLSVQENEFIFDAAIEFCVNIATHQHGCRILQRCIEYSKGKSRDKLVKEICKHGLQLARDEYGNYVVQFVIKMENLSSSTKFTLIAQFEGNYVNLSKQKFSSHVVETCLDYIPESRDMVVRELLSEEFEHLMQHPFANYVIQSALSMTKGHLHRSLAEAVRQHKKLHTSPYCKKIFSKNLLKK